MSAPASFGPPEAPVGPLKFGYLFDEPGHHIWSLRGPRGGIHVWAHHIGPVTSTRWHGGIEMHLPHGEGPAHNPECWLLEGPCWHDGSSLAFDDLILPRLGIPPFSAETHMYIATILLQWYQAL